MPHFTRFTRVRFSQLSRLISPASLGDWQRQRIRVTAPKTEHHEGRESREIPIFPELVEPLRDAWDQACGSVSTNRDLTNTKPESTVNHASYLGGWGCLSQGCKDRQGPYQGWGFQV